MSDFKTSNAAVELFQVIFNNGGTMELGQAFAQLASKSKDEVLAKYGKVSNMVAKFPNHFTLNRSKRSSVVEVKLPVEFCPDAGKKTGCVNANCQKLHICTHLILGTCTFGEKCRKSHSIDLRMQRALQGARLGFMPQKPAILLKLLKQKVKEAEIQMTAKSRGIPDTCKHYNHESGCSKGLNCPFLHVCSHYISGDCKFEDLDDGCMREHSFKDAHNKKVLKAYNMNALQELQILKMLQGSDRKCSVSTASSGSIPSGCKHYNHESGCSKGINCTFLHVCSHYISGDCKFKGGCKREHSFKDAHNIKVLNAYSMHGLHELKILKILQGSDRKRAISTSSSDSIPSETSNYLASMSSPRNTTSTGTMANKADHLDICGFHLRGKCSYGDKCMNRHTQLPYLWQYCHNDPSAGSVAAWEDVSDDLNIIIEEEFCDETVHSFRTTLGKNRYVIDFNEMTVKPREATDIRSLKLRRLSTVSSVVAPLGHIYSTKWCWYWKDENNKWQSYDTPDDTHPASTASSDIFEKNFQADRNGDHPFSTSRHKYTMYFGRWRQENDVHHTQRPVRRRPEFVSKEDMIEIAKRKRPVGNKGAAVADSGNALPAHWEPMPDASTGEDFTRVTLQTISDEYKRAEKLFEGTMAAGHIIHKIERVQNEDLWMEYIRKKQKLAKKAGGESKEKQLFHGTSEATVEAICQQGFDWRMCGKHGTAYGEGSYFASTALYSHKYARAGRPTATRLKLFLAKVVVGSYVTGSPGYARPPPKDASKPHELYDSCVDNTANPGIYVVFDNGQSYPELLITYS